MKEGLIRTVAISSVLLSASLVSPVYARPASANHVGAEEICTADGREVSADGTTANGNRIFALADALIRHRTPASEAERLRPCLPSDFHAAQRALALEPRDDETQWIEEFLQDAPIATQPAVFRQNT